MIGRAALDKPERAYVLETLIKRPNRIPKKQLIRKVKNVLGKPNERFSRIGGEPELGSVLDAA